MATSPTQRSLKRLRELGYVAQVVERWCPFSRRRIDLWGIVDIMAVHPGAGVLAVQATSGNGGNHAARRDKAMENENLPTILEAGVQFELWSWAKRGPRGKRKLWTLRREPITLDDLLN